MEKMEKFEKWASVAPREAPEDASSGVLIKKYLEVATCAARQAGSLIKSAYLEDKKKVQVKDGVDLVTETDKASEDLILETLRDAFPSHHFLGEESSFADSQQDLSEGTCCSGSSVQLGNGPTWIIDPLDGTTNFVCGFPMFCVSIALVVKKVPIVGVIYNPVLDDIYTASIHGGAFLNGQQIRVSDTSNLGDAVIVNNIGASRDSNFILTTLSRIEVLLKNKIRAYRSTGSAAMNMCYVASGKFDVFYEDGYGGPWDVAAGLILIAEAGGVCLSVDGSSFALDSSKGNKILCGNGQLLSVVASTLAQAHSAPTPVSVASRPGADSKKNMEEGNGQQKGSSLISAVAVTTDFWQAAALTVTGLAAVAAGLLLIGRRPGSITAS